MATVGPTRRVSVTVIPETPIPLLDAFTFDAVMSANEQHPGQAFRHPVQSGAEGITDAVYIDSPVFSVTGISANTPIIPLLGFLPFSGGGVEADNMITAVELFLLIRQLRIPVAVLCSWRPPMRNRWPEVIGLERNQQSGNTINVTVNFVKMRIVQDFLIPQLQDSDILAMAQLALEVG